MPFIILNWVVKRFVRPMQSTFQTQSRRVPRVEYTEGIVVSSLSPEGTMIWLGFKTGNGHALRWLVTISSGRARSERVVLAVGYELVST